MINTAVRISEPKRRLIDGVDTLKNTVTEFLQNASKGQGKEEERIFKKYMAWAGVKDTPGRQKTTNSSDSFEHSFGSPSLRTKELLTQVEDGFSLVRRGITSFLTNLDQSKASLEGLKSDLNQKISQEIQPLKDELIDRLKSASWNNNGHNYHETSFEFHGIPLNISIIKQQDFGGDVASLVFDEKLLEAKADDNFDRNFRELINQFNENFDWVNKIKVPTNESNRQALLPTENTNIQKDDLLSV
ncbi:MAG: hypothetical protein HRT47_05610 [Candidatus Caenarcaniphilales bacterium]|nr:hypothetical protein [Candidatus Caenarcaniphilales bacterium]